VEKMQSEGVQIQTSMQAVKVLKKDTGIELNCVDGQDNEHIFSSEQLLVAVGRKVNTENLGLEKIGVEITKKSIVVDEYMQTTIKNIFAAGDVVGPYMFSHIAWLQAVTAVKNICIPIIKKKISYDSVVWVTFCAPELASLGLNYEQAIGQYGKNKVKLYKRSYSTIDRAHTDSATEGLVKVVCDNNGYILGAQIIGARAGELISELQLAKTKNILFHTLYEVVHPYPTYSEILWHLSKKAYVEKIESNMFVKLYKKFF